MLHISAQFLPLLWSPTPPSRIVVHLFLRPISRFICRTLLGCRLLQSRLVLGVMLLLGHRHLPNELPCLLGRSVPSQHLNVDLLHESPFLLPRRLNKVLGKFTRLFDAPNKLPKKISARCGLHQHRLRPQFLNRNPRNPPTLPIPTRPTQTTQATKLISPTSPCALTKDARPSRRTKSIKPIGRASTLTCRARRVPGLIYLNRRGRSSNLLIGLLGRRVWGLRCRERRVDPLWKGKGALGIARFSLGRLQEEEE